MAGGASHRPPQLPSFTVISSVHIYYRLYPAWFEVANVPLWRDS
jgi:hypothetical protein